MALTPEQLQQVDALPSDWELIPTFTDKGPAPVSQGSTMRIKWQARSWNREQLEALNGTCFGVGVKLGPDSGGLLVIDYDARKGDRQSARRCFEETFGYGWDALPQTVAWTSGKPGRAAVAFVVPMEWWDEMPNRRIWGDDTGDLLEARFRDHYSVVIGAHPETEGYRYLPGRSPDDVQVAEAPEWLLEVITRQEEIKPVTPSSDDAERAVEMLKFISPEENESYAKWLRVGIALHHTDDGLLETWTDWSRQMDNFDSDEVCLKKWQSFKERKGGLSIASLHEWAKAGGYKEPKAKPEGGATGDDEIASAGELLDISERLADGRKLFSIHGLLPTELADAVELLQRPLPTDDLSAVIALLTGYSGLLKLGTRVASSINYSVPANLFAAMVMHSGGAKTAVKRALVDDPAHDIRRDAAREHRRAVEAWQAEDRKERSPKQPPAVFPHLSDYTPAALSMQLQHNETLGLGQLVVADELSGLLQAMAQDMKNGSGAADRQLLETFDGDGYSSIRVESAPRCYDACHVSIFGNIQPELLRELINGEDSSGKFARFLFCRVPAKALLLTDDDPTDEEWDAHQRAQQTLRDYSGKLIALTPRTYRLGSDARKAFNAWFNHHQQTALLPAMPGVVRSLLGKTSAHALRVAGNLHLLKVAAGEITTEERISRETMDAAMAIVDQLTRETEAFHETPETDATRLMRHIHQLAWTTGKPVDRQQTRDRCKRGMRDGCTAEAFKTAVETLVDHRYGELVTDGVTLSGKRKGLRYAAIREMSQ